MRLSLIQQWLRLAFEIVVEALLFEENLRTSIQKTFFSKRHLLRLAATLVSYPR